MPDRHMVVPCPAGSWIWWIWWIWCLNRAYGGVLLISGTIFMRKTHSISTKMIRISKRASQLESGRLKDIMMHPCIKIPYLTPTWITNIWQFILLSQHDLWLEISNAWTQAPQSQHDRALMEIFSESSISNFKLFHLNCCRIFLNCHSCWYSHCGPRVALMTRKFQRQEIKGQKISASLAKPTWTYRPAKSRLEISSNQMLI